MSNMAEAGGAPASPPQFVVEWTTDPRWPPQPDPEAVRVRIVVAHPSFLPFLTLAEQVEAVLRYRGLWDEEGPGRITEVLQDLSVPGPHARGDLVALARVRPRHPCWSPSVGWRLALAQELASDPSAKPKAPDNKSWIVAALDLRQGWTPAAQDCVGKFLRGWSNSRGRVSFVTDDQNFAKYLWSHAKQAVDVPPSKEPPAARPAPSPGPWDWAVWMTFKEGCRRPLWLSKEMDVLASLLGFFGHAFAASWAETTSYSVRAVLFLLLVLICLLFQERLWAKRKDVMRWFGPSGKWSHASSTYRWKLTRNAAAAMETFASCLMGGGAGILIDLVCGSQGAAAVVVFADFVVSLLSGILAFLWLTWGAPRWAIHPFADLARWFGSLARS